MDPFILIGSLLIGGLVSGLALAMMRDSPPSMFCNGCRVRSSRRFEHSSAGHAAGRQRPARMNPIGRLIRYALRFNAGHRLERSVDVRRQTRQPVQVVRRRTVVWSQARRM
jgi:hypothetical protein